jgi:hypothetical protein
MFRALVVLSALTVVVATDVAAQQKAAWRWSQEERIAKRFDPAEIAARQVRRLDGSSSSGPSGLFVVDGSVEPELFLPWELLDMFFTRVGSNPEQFRQTRDSYSSAIAKRGWDAGAFWRDMADIRASYDVARTTQAALFPGSSETVEEKRSRERQRESADLQICRARADALSTALARYRDFDRFLYEEVAPTLVMRSSTPTDAMTLRWIAGGCR